MLLQGQTVVSLSELTGGLYTLLGYESLKVESSVAAWFEDRNHKKQASNSVDNWQRDEVQNAL